MNATMLRPNRARLLAVLGVLATAGLLGYMLFRERGALLAHEWVINWWSIFYAFLVMIFTFSVVALAWATQMRAVGSKLPVWIHVDYYVASHLVRRLPGTLWYIAGRGYLYRQQGESARLVAIVSGQELALLTSSGALLALLFWGISFHDLPIGYLFALVGMFAIGLILLHPASISWVMQRIGRAETLHLRYRQLSMWFLMYLVAWFGSGLIFYFLVDALVGIDIKHAPYAIGSWALVGSLSTIVFFLPTNFGFTEVGLSLLLSSLMPASLAVIVAVSVRIILTLFDILSVSLWFAVGKFWQHLQGQKRDSTVDE